MGNFDRGFGELGVNFHDFFFTVLIYYVPKQLLNVNMLDCLFLVQAQQANAVVICTSRALKGHIKVM